MVNRKKELMQIQLSFSHIRWNKRNSILLMAIRDCYDSWVVSIGSDRPGSGPQLLKVRETLIQKKKMSIKRKKKKPKEENDDKNEHKIKLK